MPIILFFILSQVLWAKTPWKEQYLLNGCTVYSTKGVKVREFPGLMCLFKPNGDLYSAQIDKLSRIDSKSKTIWSISAEFHHQLNFSQDGNRILTLSTDYEKRGKIDKFGVDKFLIIDLNGKILHQASAKMLVDHIGVKESYNSDELTHFNSIYEIPTLEGSGHPAYLKPGNIIVNSYKFGVFILSPDLAQVLHHFKFPSSFDHRVHDVQVLPNGHYLLFNNIVSGQPITNYYSAAQETNTAGEVVQEFSTNPREAFFSLNMGGVQVVEDDIWLVSHSVAGAYIYSMRDKKIIQNIYQTHYSSHRFIPAQQIKLVDLKDFLKFWN